MVKYSRLSRVEVICGDLSAVWCDPARLLGVDLRRKQVAVVLALTMAKVSARVIVELKKGCGGKSGGGALFKRLSRAFDVRGFSSRASAQS